MGCLSPAPCFKGSARPIATGLNSIEAGVKPPFNAHSTREANLAAHRRAHRSGKPSNIDVDPELRAFIIARLATHTFTQIRNNIAANFPPDRRTSLSALSRWWHREGKHLSPQPQDTGLDRQIPDMPPTYQDF